jgi:cyclophilin family peptidyl-prolyl cis-trans isomerase
MARLAQVEMITQASFLQHCQCYIVQNQRGLTRLAGDEMIYGQVIQGMDILDKMVKGDRIL